MIKRILRLFILKSWGDCRVEQLTNMLVCCFFLSLGLGFLRGTIGIRDLFALKESHRLLSSAVNSLEKENEDITEEIEKIKRSRDYSMKVLKDKYHVTEEDEAIIFVPE